MLNRKYYMAFTQSALVLLSLLQIPSLAIANSAMPVDMGGVINMGLTFGGDKLATAEFTDGDSEDIDAGELLFFSGGVTATQNEIQYQVTIGYYFDQANGDNGEINFTRYPLDLLAFWKQEKFRIGGGITYHISPQFKVDIDGASENRKDKYNDAFGFALQADYIFISNATLGIRLTSIKYESSNELEFSDKSGDSVGIVLGYLF